MMQALITKIVIIGVLVLYLVGSTMFGIKMYQQYTRVSDNQEILLQQVDGLKKDNQLVLTPNEFRRLNDSSTTAIMKTLNIKTKNLEQIIKATSYGGTTITTVPRDTFIIRNDTLIPATTFNYVDPYLTLSGVQTKTQTQVTWTSQDSLSVLLYWQREGKFLPKIFGNKVYKATIKGENPYMKYVVNQNIKIQKQ